MVYMLHQSYVLWEGILLHCCYSFNLRSFFRKPAVLFLAFLLAVGFSFGAYTACISAPVLSSMMRMAASGCVSIVRVAVVVLLPFSFAAVAVLLMRPFLLYLLVLFKSFGYGFCLCGICIVFEQAGWLICFLLLFTDSAVMATLVFFSLRHISGLKNGAFFELIVLSSCCFLVGIIDVTVIFPFLSTILIL